MRVRRLGRDRIGEGKDRYKGYALWSVAAVCWKLRASMPERDRFGAVYWLQRFCWKGGNAAALVVVVVPTTAVFTVSSLNIVTTNFFTGSVTTLSVVVAYTFSTGLAFIPIIPLLPSFLVATTVLLNTLWALIADNMGTAIGSLFAATLRTTIGILIADSLRIAIRTLSAAILLTAIRTMAADNLATTN